MEDITGKENSQGEGWRRDQFGVMRWWDGENWTDKVALSAVKDFDSIPTEVYDSSDTERRWIDNVSSVLKWNLIVFLLPPVLYGLMVFTAFIPSFLAVLFAVVVMKWVLGAAYAIQFIVGFVGTFQILSDKLPKWYLIFSILNTLSGAGFIALSLFGGDLLNGLLAWGAISG